ncbi:LamB/YcsF family protein [Paraglaciecola sp.]|uniref:LamB/YcsF family protein n=1 Tax=Paraglaciecola sp. TaxID=1920173 RepID=UPI003EFB0D4E
MKAKAVDINCDLGEGKTIEDCQQDALLMPFISRCNIACGGHAGNRDTMAQTLKQALDHELICGAHPGYPDPDNFGRVSLNIPVDDLLTSVTSQIQTLLTLAKSLGQPLSHIKLHGALYNDAEKSAKLADALCQEFASRFNHLSLIGLSKGQMERAAAQHKLSFLREGFIDRAYLSNGQLAPRVLAGSVYQESKTCIQQALSMIARKPINTLPQDNTKQDSVLIEADTFCLHGDSPIAYSLAKKLHQQLSDTGYKIA